MKIVLLKPNQFDDFSSIHPLHSYYQTSMYGSLMEKCGYDVKYYGFIDDNNNLVGASLVLEQKLVFSYKYAYAPRGMLIDYDNRDLVIDITENLKRYFSKRKVAFFKIDPPVINNKRDKDGNVIEEVSSSLVSFLEGIGYSYYGDNKGFGTLKPRWNAILKVTGSSDSLFNNFSDSTRNKIRKAQSRGVEVLQGNANDIDVFYKFVAKKHYRKVSYYHNFAESFGNNLELYFAKLNTGVYLKNIKRLYEEELDKNEKLNIEIQSSPGNTKIVNSKMTSDKLISVYKKELLDASKLFDKYPKGILIGASAVIIDKHSVSLLIEGYKQDFSLFYPNFLIKWFIIEKYSKLGAIYFDLNAITGYFDNNSKFKGLNEMKLGFNADVTEYVGEFDLVINKGVYKFSKSKKNKF